MAYNFMLVMANTGMRTMEARNLRWRDIDVRKDQHERVFVCMSVRGKGKFGAGRGAQRCELLGADQGDQ